MSEAERRSIAAELPDVIRRLRSGASSDGVISPTVFDREAERLGLGTEEQRRRLRTGLAGVGLRVKTRPRPKDVRERPYAVPTPAPVSAMLPSEAARRLAQARTMLGRYADADGRVGRLAHEGVVHLHGLGPAEARELSAHFPVNRPRPVDAAAWQDRAAGSGAEPSEGARKAPGGPAMSAGDGSLREAVLAARAVLEADRWRRDLGARLLGAQEEVGLAVLLRGGVGDLGRDVPKEEIATLPYGGDAWRAHECLVLHNVRLVWKVAQAYQGRGLDIEDLVQHGTLGLMRAVRKFDAGQGYKLSTYATQWIRQSISRAIADEGTLIRIPVHLHEKVNKVAAAERKLLSEGRPRTVENVAFATGFTFEEVERVRRISRPTDSLDRIIGDDTALGDLIVGPSRLPGPCTVLLRKELFELVGDVVMGFPEREAHILVRRTGLDGGEPATLEELGVVFSVTRERIRQIESKTKPLFRDRLVQRGLKPPAP
ncbi:RNA polymerase sigma factor RpoD/SigA [Streptomyces sp. NPDC021019]|uniref:sigma-70 family RNA polymerase sigma factor n=1 Tax=unclassified Streptomyces TaxID=2593676 RepID=UPI0037AAAD8F